MTVRLARVAGFIPTFAALQRVLLLGVAAALVAPALPVLAQQAGDESVKIRARPEYDPVGVRLDDAMKIMSRIVSGNRKAQLQPDAKENLGSFLLNTQMDFIVSQDDNIFREANNEVSDTIFQFRPKLDVTSQWANHGLNLSMGGEFGRYASNDSEDYEDFNASVGGKLDIDEGDVANFSVSWRRGHEARESLDDVGAPEPTIYRETAFNGVYNHDAGEIFSRTTFSWSYLDYDDNNGVNNDDRDRWVYEIKQRFGHDIDEGSQAFVEGSLSYRDYRLKFDDNGRKLGSLVTEGLVGLIWDASGVTFAEIAAGYLVQDFKDSANGQEASFSFRGRVVWNVTGLVTLSSNFGREAKETSQANASSELVTNYGLTLDWEALYNLIITAESKLTFSETKGTGDEEDTTLMALRAEWLIDNHWRLGGAIEREVRESNTATNEYSNTRFIVRLTERI